MKSLFQILTLQSTAISAHRKQQLIFTILMLGALLSVQMFTPRSVLIAPYAIKIVEVTTYTLFINIIISIFRIFVVSGHRRRRNISNDEHDNFTVGMNAIVNATTVLATITFIFVVFDIEFRAFLSSIALVAVALTIIFQDFIKNFLFGFAIMFTADYEIGNYIQVGSMPKGVILNITFSNVQLKTESGDVLYIPNTVMRDNEVVNFSKLKPKRINVEFALLRTQLVSVNVFEKALFSYLQKTHPAALEVEKCRLYVKETNKDEVLFTLEAFTKKASLKLKEQINHSVQKFSVEYTEAKG
jgi:small-conductance mechanosensitive channel